jgi:dipeptidyl aminopeptidase/acylaminoacyl peptidase
MTTLPPGSLFETLSLSEPIAADAIAITELAAGSEAVYALVSTPFTGAESRLLQFGADPMRALAPSPLNIGNKVHGYGLHALAPTSPGLIVSERGTPALHRVLGPQAGSRIRLMPAGAVGDPAWHARSARLVAVLEAGSASARNEADHLVSIAADGTFNVLFEQAGLLSHPACSPDDRVACVAWELPWMPWQRSSVWLGSINGDSSCFVRVPTPADAAVAQPFFGPRGALYFLCDATGYFELWTFDGDTARPVSRLEADIGLSLSRQTSRSIALLPGDVAAAVVWRRGVSQLHLIDPSTGHATALATPIAPADQLVAQGSSLWYAALPVEGPVELHAIDASGRDTLMWSAPAIRSPPAPAPATITLTAVDGESIDAHLFRAAPKRRRGILIINLHGGPNSLAQRQLRGALRVLRDDGYDIAELNYRGSAGFGRHYRDRLDGQWGVVDVEDVLTASARFEELGVAPRARTVLRGASAGGYTALNTLSLHGGFAGGIIYFGVSDLQTLAVTTHRYESGFLGSLLGAADPLHRRYVDRSPMRRVDSIAAPLLLLQGADDRVTPPAQSIAIAEHLQCRGRQARLHIFENEAHGFTQLATLQECCKLERDFLSALG